MAPITTTIQVERSIDEVFAYATDPTRFSEWQKGVTGGHMEADGIPTVGTRCHTTRRIGGADRPSVSEVTHVDPPKSWGVRGIDGPIRAIVNAAPHAHPRRHLVVGRSVRLTTAFNRLLQLPGASVQSVAFTDRGVVIGLRRRRRRMVCPCSRATRARYDTSRRRWRHLDFGACQVWLEADPATSSGSAKPPSARTAPPAIEAISLDSLSAVIYLCLGGITIPLPTQT